MRASSLFEAFQRSHRTEGSVTILGDQPRDEETRSHEEMFDSASLRAGGLAEQGVERGEVVGLFARTTFDFLIGCLAVWRRGAIVMPLASPARLVSQDAWEDRIRALLNKAGVKAIIPSPGDPTLRTDVPLIAATESAGRFTDAMPAPSDIALIQFSSGSTTAPKGVVLEHGAILSNLASVGKRECPTPDDGAFFFSWVPFSHDLGFINYFLLPLSMGRSSSLLPTDLFVRTPLRWLDEMSRYRATMCGAPNFAFGLAARELEKDADRTLDLSAWSYAGNGGETVSENILERFIAASARHGFDRGSLIPGYGLAEATCTVTSHFLGEGWTVDHVDRSALAAGVAHPVSAGRPGVASFVSLGSPLDGVKVVISDEEGVELEDRHVGEVLVKAPSVMRGYLSDSEATEAAFRDGWLRTGDLGYIRDGRLYVTGRSKDTIVVGGQNFYAEDIERVVQRVRGVRPGNAVAVATLSGGAEGLAVIAETNADPDATRTVRQAIAHEVLTETGIAPTKVLLVPPRSVPKTTSGKLQRQRAKQMLEEGAFSGMAPPNEKEAPTPMDPLELQLLSIWRSVLEIDSIDPHDDFFLLGGSSVQAASILALIEDQLGRSLPLSVILRAPTIAKLAAILRTEPTARPPRVVPLQTEGSKTPFFCVHGGGGNVFHLLPLAHHLTGRRPFYGLLARGSDGTEAPHDSIEEMASDYIAQMLQIHEGPYLLLGYSFGGVVAYEMAAQLHRAGEDVALLGLLDAPSLESASRSPLLDPAKWRKGPKSALRYARTTLDRQTTRLKGRLALAMQKPLPAELITEFMMVHSGRLMARYRGGGYPGPVHYFRVVDSNGRPMAPRSEGWEKLAGDRLRVQDVEGPNHVAVLQEPWVGSLANALAVEADKALASRNAEAMDSHG